MNDNSTQSDLFLGLLNNACDDILSTEESRELADLLAADPEARRVYIDHLTLRRYVQSRFRSDWVCEVGLARVQETLGSAPVAAYPAIGPLPIGFGGNVGFMSSGWPVAYFIATVIFAIGAILGSITYVSPSARVAQESPSLPSPPSPQASSVGRITGTANCRWADPNNAPNAKTVRLDQVYELSSGLLEITYATGAKVILQGPVTYRVESENGGFLAVGRMIGRVESERAHGFSVRTPRATVTDLGTEFGVEVNRDGQDRVYVFQGRVALQASGKDSSDPIVLEAGQSSRVDSRGTITRQTAENATILPSTFVRKMPKTPRSEEQTSLSLADMIAGGNGFTERSGWGIDPRDAHVVVQFSGENLASSGRYEPFSGVPQIDGVFIPNGKTQVDSANHLFDLPKTNGTTCGPIWVTKGSEWIGPPAQPRLVARLHANSGITFNLTAMRKAARQQLAGFQSSVAYRPQFDHFIRSYGADVWVLVDGQLRFDRTNLRDEDGLIPIDIPLTAEDQYLTLIATEGVDNNFGDHIQFLDPRILLEDRAN